MKAENLSPRHIVWFAGIFIVGAACGLYFVQTAIIGTVGGLGNVGEPRVYESARAQREIEGQVGWSLTRDSDAYLFDNGSFGGSGLYAAATFDSLDDCLEAIAVTSHYVDRLPHRQSMLEWDGKSIVPAIMDGPGHFGKEYSTALWDVREVTNGLYFQESRGDSTVAFWLIDVDRFRLFYHYQSGGVL